MTHVCDICDETSVQDLGQHRRVVGLPGVVRYLCGRHKVRSFAAGDFSLSIEQAAERVQADRDRRGGAKRGDVGRVARKYGLDTAALTALVDAAR